MKLGIAALILGSAAAFAPANTGKGASVLAMTATGTETCTFTKSEEIFKEAQEVSFHLSVEAKKTTYISLVLLARNGGDGARLKG